MQFKDTGFAGLYLIELDLARDERGYFARTFCVDTFNERGLQSHYPQSGTSFNAKSGTVRGMHFQKPPHGEVKLIRCTRGAIHDVVIDIRPGSATYLKHYDVELAEGDGRELYVPDGFAHGFQTSAGCERSSLHAVDALRAGGGERVSLGRSGICAVLAAADYGDFRPRPELAVARWKNGPMKLAGVRSLRTGGLVVAATGRKARPRHRRTAARSVGRAQYAGRHAIHQICERRLGRELHRLSRPRGLRGRFCRGDAGQRRGGSGDGGGLTRCRREISHRQYRLCFRRAESRAVA